MKETQQSIESTYSGGEFLHQDSETAHLAVAGITKFLIGGMDGAGKSTLACSAYAALKEQKYDVSLHELDPWSDTHAPILGQKDWSQRRKRSKVWRTTYEKTIQPFFDDESTIVLGDMQGRSQYEHNDLLTDSADFAVLVTRYKTEKDNQIRYPQTQEAWEKLFTDLNIPIGLRVHSIRKEQQPPEKTITAINLDRELTPYHPDVLTFAGMVIRLAQFKHNI